MKHVLVPLAILLCTACQAPKSEGTPPELPVAVVPDSIPPTTEAEIETAPLPVTFAEIPAELQQLVGALRDIEQLKTMIDSARGCYLLEEGPGVYPIITPVKTIEDLLANSEFIRFVNASYPTRSYYVNVPDLDRCNLPTEGLYFNRVENGRFLYDAYATNLAAADGVLPDDLKVKLTALDEACTWFGTINLTDKTGEVIALNLHLAQAGDRMFIAAVDTRGCGI